jgi:tRNA(Ile2) C34 agmatinyltransferase TiaS
MVKETEAMDTKASKNGERCPTCRKPMANVGRTGRFRCSNPKCRVVFVTRDDDRRSGFRSRGRWRG